MVVALATLLVERSFEIQFVISVWGQNWGYGGLTLFHLSCTISGGLILIELTLQC